jgi:hypothetical protein
MEKMMIKEQKTTHDNQNQESTNQNPVQNPTDPQLSPEQQEWLNSVFVPNLRNQIRQSSQKEIALTAGERQELAAYRDQSEQIAQNKLEQKGEFEELLRRQKDESTRKYAVLEREKNELGDRFVNMNIEHALVDSANLHKAVKPGQVMQLLRPRIAVDHFGEISVLDEDGQPMIGTDGEFMSVDAFVEQFINDNPHMVKPEDKKPVKSAGNGRNGIAVDLPEPADPFVGVTGGDLIRQGLFDEEEKRKHIS